MSCWWHEKPENSDCYTLRSGFKTAARLVGVRNFGYLEASKKSKYIHSSGKVFRHSGSLTGCDPAISQADILRKLQGSWNAPKWKTRSISIFIPKLKNDWNSLLSASKDEDRSKVTLTAERACRLLPSFVSWLATVRVLSSSYLPRCRALTGSYQGWQRSLPKTGWGHRLPSFRKPFLFLYFICLPPCLHSEVSPASEVTGTRFGRGPALADDVTDYERLGGYRWCHALWRRDCWSPWKLWGYTKTWSKVWFKRRQDK